MDAQKLFRQVSPAEDPHACELAVEALVKVLANDSLANYFTRSNAEATSQFLRAALQLALQANPARQLIWADHSAVAVLQHFPADRLPPWSRRAALLRLMAIAPWGKWRALAECAGDLDRQKQAFYASRGEFWYIFALGSARPGQGLGSALLAHICRLADAAQRTLYVEATSDRTRRWYKRAGFAELMTFNLRVHAPRIVVLARPPRPASAPAAAAGGAQPPSQART